jgi:YVTN family beta-propeller protein
MNNLFSIVVLISMGIVVMTFSSCNHDGMHDMDKNINYPAAYVVNGASNTLSVIKLDDNSVSETISLNGATFPHHININPGKTQLAVAITSTDLSGGHAGHGGATAGLKVLIINAITGKIDKEILLPKLPHNAVFNSSGTELWIGQFDSIESQVLVFKTSDWSVQNTINVGKGVSEITFSNDGNIAFACNTVDGTVSIIDANSKMVQKTLTVGQDPVGAWTASNGNMYVDNERSQTISEISASGMNVTNTIDLGFKPAFVAFHAGVGELWVTDATNGKLVYFTQVNGIWTIKGNILTGADAHAIVFNSAGTKAYVTNQGEGNVSVIDVSTHSVSHSISVGSKPNGIVLKQ